MCCSRIVLLSIARHFFLVESKCAIPLPSKQYNNKWKNHFYEMKGECRDVTS